MDDSKRLQCIALVDDLIRENAEILREYRACVAVGIRCEKDIAACESMERQLRIRRRALEIRR